MSRLKGADLGITGAVGPAGPAGPAGAAGGVLSSYKGAYSGTSLYQPGDVVTYLGSSYLATAVNGLAGTVDDFNRADGAYTGVFTTNGAAPNISSGAIVSPDAGTRVVSLQTNSNKHFVEADFILQPSGTGIQTSDAASIALGATSTTGDGNWTILFIGKGTDGSLQIANSYHDGSGFTSTGGTTTVKYSQANYTSSAVKVRAEYDGSTGQIVLSVNGSQVATFVGSGYQAAGTVGLVGVRGSAKADRVAIGALAAVAFDSTKYVALALKGDPGATGAAGAAGGGYTRTTATVTTPSLANGAVFEGTIPMAAAYRLYHLTSNQAARTRLYTRNDRLVADRARAPGIDPAVNSNSGLMLDFTTTSSLLAADLAPLVDGANLEDAPSVNIPISITNNDVSGPVTVTFTYLRTE